MQVLPLPLAHALKCAAQLLAPRHLGLDASHRVGRVAALGLRAEAAGALQRSHDAIALALLAEDDEAEFIVATDARRRELAWTSYTGLDADGFPIRETEPALVLRAESDAAFLGWIWEETTTLSGGHLGTVAARAIAANRVVGPHEPLYLRSPDIAAPKVHV